MVLQSHAARCNKGDEGVALPTTVSLAAAMQLEQDRNLYKVHIVQSVWNHN